MAEMSPRQVHDDTLSLFDEAWLRLASRLDGLTQAEYVWEPVPGCWTVRDTPDGPKADWAEPNPDPAPLTTIAWRLWHIAIDCLDSYSARVFGRTGTGLTGPSFTLDAGEARTLLARAGEVFRAGLATTPPEALFDPLGPSWGPYGEATFFALTLHALDEVVHHGAEIALMRDLYRARR